MSEFVISPSARRDLWEIADWYEEHASHLAERLFSALHRQFQILARSPGIGRARPELGPGVRRFVVSPYLIFFRASTMGIEIARVLHGRRNITPDMFE
jgi:toxin ParE1/3/4